MPDTRAALFLMVPLFLYQADPFAVQRDQMVREQIEARGVANPEVLRSMRSTPRHLFVPEDWRPHSDLADTLAAMGQWKDAIAEYKAALIGDGRDSSEVWRRLGVALAKQGDSRAAVRLHLTSGEGLPAPPVRESLQL